MTAIASASALLADLSNPGFDMSVFTKTHPSLIGVTKDNLIHILQKIIQNHTTSTRPKDTQSTSSDDESDACATPCASIVMRAYSASVTKATPKSPEQELIELIELIEKEFLAQGNQEVSDMTPS